MNDGRYSFPANRHLPPCAVFSTQVSIAVAPASVCAESAYALARPLSRTPCSDPIRYPS